MVCAGSPQASSTRVVRVQGNRPAGQRGLAWRCTSWLLDGGYEWTVDPFLAASHPFEEIKSYGGDWLFPHAYGSLFTSMKPTYFRHFLLDMVTNIVAGIFAAIPAVVAAVTNADNDPLPVRNACNGALHASTAVQLLFAVVCITERPVAVAVRSELIFGASMACLGALNALLASVQATSLADATIDDWGNGVQSLQRWLFLLLQLFWQRWNALRRWRCSEDADLCRLPPS